MTIGCLSHSFALKFRAGHQACEEPESAVGIGKCCEHQRLQVVFTVNHIAKRRVVQAIKDTLGLRKGLARQDPGMLERNRIALLRHNTAGLYVAVGKPQKSELCRAPAKQFLYQPAEVRHRDGDGGRTLGEIINRSNGAVGITLQSLETRSEE